MTDTAAAPPRTSAKPVDPRLLRYASASRWFFVTIAVIAFVQTGLIVTFAFLLTALVFGLTQAAPLADMMPIIGLLAVTVALRAILVWARDAVAARASARVQAQLRAHLVTAVGILGPGWLSTRNTAQLAVTAGRGLDALDAYFGRYLPQLVQTVIATPLIILAMLFEDVISGLTVILTIPLIPIFMVLIGLATRSVQQRQWKTLHQLAARFSDTVQGLSTLKVFGRQNRAVASIDSVADTYRRETMRVLRVSFLSGFALEFLASISVAIIAVTIGFRLLDGSLMLGVGLFVLLLAPEAYLPLRQVGVQFHAASEGVAATDDVFEVLDAARRASRPANEPADPVTVATAPINAVTDTGRVLRLEAVRVVRGARSLGPVEFPALPGTVTLIEGPSGSGKTSILAALRGAAEFEGFATYGGVDVRSLLPAEWLAWAGQQPGLIAGTVGSNVSLGDPEPDAAAIRRALDLAGADGIDPRLELGVQGAGLSGGQAQRVAVARAFYRHLTGRADVIALDEPSSALDADTEARLWTAVRSLADDGALVLLISHRTSARRIANTVVQLAAQEVPV